MEYDKVIFEGIEYPVAYRSDKVHHYAKVLIKGIGIEGYGKEAETAYRNLEQKIYQYFTFKLGAKE